MHDRLFVAISILMYPAAAAVLERRSTPIQRAHVVALSVAASLLPSPALAQSVNVLNPGTDILHEASKRQAQTASNPATTPRRRRLNQAPRPIGSLALAPTTSMLAAKRDGAHDVALKRTQKQIDPFAKFENLREKGMWLNIPGPADTIDQDTGGVRSALADLGIGYAGWTLNAIVDNQLPNAARSTIANQLYMGQNPTFYSANIVTVTYDLSRFGISDGQIVVGAEQQYWTWERPGPDRLGLNTLAYYQTFFDRKLELKLGYLRNQNEFAGAVTGAITGATLFLLYQAGMSNNAAPRPAVNLKYNFDDRLYDKVSIQRSLNPDGQYAEITENPTGLNWSTANAGVLLIDEIGYKTKAAPGIPDTWLRAGFGFNNSHYRNVVDPARPRANDNHFYYVAADRQLWQSDARSAPSHGIYGGFSVMGAPPDVSRLSQYYELRLYARGLFDSRPTDQIALVATNMVWSKFAVDAALTKQQLAHRDTTAISATYTAHLAPGIYASVGLTYIHNPTSITHAVETGHALNLLVSTSIFF
ncbi:carbohydrate porin [Bradyrhizobium sp. ORS 86]|uniref:carbohydrate porin n=1 Tax=Bradyrhizobium sp. ORS 86 TaxID=1685970 RepID=UPI0038910F2B